MKTDPGDHGWQCQLRSLAATTTRFRAAGAAGAWVPERASLVSAGERRCGGAGGRTGTRGLSSPLPPSGSTLLRAGRPAGLPGCSSARPQRGCSPLLAAKVSYVGTSVWGDLRKETAHKGWRETSIRKVTPPSCGVKSGVFCLLCMSCSALSPDPDEGSQGYLVLRGR